MPLNPELPLLRTAHEAWEAALGQLQMEMPKASFDTWVRDTHLVSYADGLFTIGVGNADAREWLECRLTSTVMRLLMGMMDRDISVAFIVNTPAAEEGEEVRESDPDDKGQDGESETTNVQVVHRLRYDELVHPDRVVAIPGYFSRLIPEIGARSAWLYIGWRQAVWDGQRQEGGSKTRRVPVREIIRFSGLSRRTFFRAVEELSTWQALSGLVERCDEKPRWSRGKDRRAHRLPNHYTVHMTLPLSRADAVSVREWLSAHVKGGMSLLDTLRKACQTQELVGELLPPVGIPAEESAGDIPRTVMEIASQLSGSEGRLPPDLLEASEALHRKILSAFGTILLTHYFLEIVIPNAKLTPHQAWLIALLRDRCYLNRDTGEVRDEVLVRGGYAELADWLGLNRSKTVWEWIRDDQGPVSAFLAILPSLERDDPDSLRLRVRLDEPIFAGASDTNRLAQVAPLDGADDIIKPGANDTHKLAEVAPLNGAAGTLKWREWHSLKLLNTSLNTPERITPTTQETSAAAPAYWNLKTILVENRVHPKVTKDLLAKNASAQDLVSWLLFACSPAGEGIKNPLAYALAALRDDPERGPGGAYDRLAALPPAELIHLARWSVKRSSRKYDFTADSSGNKIWDKLMGASDRHGILLAVLLGEEAATPNRERKVTQVRVGGK